MPGMQHTFWQIHAAILLCLPGLVDLRHNCAPQAGALQPKVPHDLQVHVLSRVRLVVLHPCSTHEAGTQLGTWSIVGIVRVVQLVLQWYSVWYSVCAA
jgi:hypothetical protein